jgi:hypothetical protein
MRMVSSLKDKSRMGFSTEPAAMVDLSILNSVANKTRDQAWKIGDQSMKKGAIGEAASGTSRGCFQ